MWNEASAMPIPTSTPTLNLSETAALRHDRERVEEKDSDTSLSDLGPATSEPPDNATERLGPVCESTQSAVRYEPDTYVTTDLSMFWPSRRREVVKGVGLSSLHYWRGRGAP